MTGIEGQVVVITGAGRGLGRAYALDIAERGGHVVVNDRSAVHADRVVEEIRTAGGTAVASHHLVGSRVAGRAVVDLAVAEFGTLHAVVNNAGLLREAEFAEQTAADLRLLFDVHVHGAFFLTQAAWEVFRRTGYGRVVFTSSAGGMFGMHGASNYAAVKAGVFGLARALAVEGSARGIAVNVVLPHAESDIRARALEGSAPTEIATAHDTAVVPGVREAFRANRPTAAVTPLVTHLASSACPVNGEAFAAGCGRFARVFVGETRGWVAPDPRRIRPEDIAANLDAIRDLRAYDVPGDLYAEIAFMMRTVEAATDA